MSIEVRQLIVKSNVVQRTDVEEQSTLAQDQEEIRKMIAEECKKLILETLQEMKER